MLLHGLLGKEGQGMAAGLSFLHSSYCPLATWPRSGAQGAAFNGRQRTQILALY